MDGVILLTGATGLLGRYLLRDLLTAGHDVAVVVRPSDRHTAEARVASLMAAWERRGVAGLPTPHVLVGDLTEPALGLGSEDRRWVADHCDMVLHNAASLSFETAAGPDEEPWRTNLGGTRNVLELCRETGIADFHHVSTSYVCGLRDDVVFENQLDVGQSFGNDYEKSKLQAEQLVSSTDFLSPPTIYRPAIIVGDSQTGFTTTFHGFYAVVRLAATLTRLVEGAEQIDWSIPLHGLAGNEHKNLVPVDWVSSVITEVVGRRDLWSNTYHLTPTEPVQVSTIRDVIEKVIGYVGTTAFTAAGENGVAGAAFGAELESAFYDELQVYTTYFRNDPTFDRTNLLAAVPHLPCPTLDHGRLLMLAETAIAMNFKYRDPRPAKVVVK
ncbi:MAG: SDR family oxidoreductase [Planctomycetota bacterium]|nr:SDR family oxidoreductase [Planctomycetaceae bacterium]MDQ3331125.1 SDR family oxidoreductase [Planctomycetota bacterium]